ncbi:MAG: carbonic anhydrase family protein, partial [Dysgonamonadaceae bacterium]|nr:carbonic anhydrase family protein [Dysgonamonadaceae bacterium]
MITQLNVLLTCCASILPRSIPSLYPLLLCACAAIHQPAVQAPPVPAGEAKHWTYTGNTGPAYWQTLDTAYALAKDGASQSPIDIVTALSVPSDHLGQLVFAYRETEFEVENNGHTIELMPLAKNNYITIDGSAPYVLQQFHFHAPSEHTIDGKSFPMELHLVHKDEQGNLAVIGVMIAQGAENEALKEAFAALPRQLTHEGSVKPEVKINTADLFGATPSVYRYDGSLTTPPCTEGVKWIITSEAIEMSAAQIQAFTSLYAGNSR